MGQMLEEDHRSGSLTFSRRITYLQCARPAHVAAQAPWARLLADESGQDLVEYALVAALIAAAAITTVSGLANKVSNSFSTIGNNLTNAT